MSEKIDSKICDFCGNQFFVLTKNLRLGLRDDGQYGRFCSRKCHNEWQRIDFASRQVSLSCANCDKPVARIPSQAARSKSKLCFCSSSCAAKYNNAHKTYGTRRSKLEAYLEQQLRSEFPNLELICNGKDAIGSELDFYFPQLRLAIELNGIFHYEPIYGTDKLERIQANDQQKFISCNAAGIELCVIDASGFTHATSAIKERYWTIVKNLVVSLLERTST